MTSQESSNVSVVRVQRQRRLRHHLLAHLRRRPGPKEEPEEASKGPTSDEPPQQRGRKKGNNDHDLDGLIWGMTKATTMTKKWLESSLLSHALFVKHWPNVCSFKILFIGCSNIVLRSLAASLSLRLSLFSSRWNTQLCPANMESSNLYDMMLTS